MPQQKTQEALRSLSLELRDIQQPLKIVPVVQWPQGFEEELKVGHSLKPFLRRHYQAQELKFSVPEKLTELKNFRRKVAAQLGIESGAGVILHRMAQDYESVVHLLSSVGTPEFYQHSQHLWGSAHDPLFADGTTIADYARQLQKSIKDLLTPEQAPAKVLPAKAVVELMRQRMREAHLLESIDVCVSDDLTADVAAGGRQIKVKAGVMFAPQDVEVLIQHEVFTHIATSLNGRDQRFAKWLAFGTPRSTSTQEGLAILMEVFSSSIYPHRLKKILDRVVCVAMAEDKAKVGDILDFLKTEGYPEHEAYRLLSRALRGTDTTPGQAFTKDINYLKGLIECFNFVQYCLVTNRPDYIPFLFAGKVSLDDIPALYQAHLQQLVDKPRWVPSLFQDLNALSSWFICTSALGRLSDLKAQKRFRDLFSENPHHAMAEDGSRPSPSPSPSSPSPDPLT